MKCPGCGFDNSDAPIICAGCDSQFSAGAGVSESPEFKIARLDLRPGDILVLRSQRVLSMDQAQRIQSLAKREFGDHRVMVLDGGMDMAVLTAADIAERAK